MSAISQQKLEANRRNAQKSTGPRSDEGKSRSRFNALKHGATAQIPVLPGEDAAAYHGRVDAYKADLRPENTLECDLIERMALMSVQFERTTRADVARMAWTARTTAQRALLEDELEVISLGRRLLFDRRGPTPCYPNRKYLYPADRTSWSRTPHDADDPARLVKQLESNGAGCRWLLDRWADLRARLEPGQCWQSPDKLKAIRLLGRQPLDAPDVHEVAVIFLASYVLEPDLLDPFEELQCELDEHEFEQFSGRLVRRRLEEPDPAMDESAARAILLDVVDRAVNRLSALAHAHQLRQEQAAALQAEFLAFDGSVEAERIRRYATASDRGMHRALTMILKLRKEMKGPIDDAPSLLGLLYPRTSDAVDESLENEPTPSPRQDLQDEPTRSDQTARAPLIRHSSGDGVHPPQGQAPADLQLLADEPHAINQDPPVAAANCAVQELQNEPTAGGAEEFPNEPTVVHRAAGDMKVAQRMQRFSNTHHQNGVLELADDLSLDDIIPVACDPTDSGCEIGSLSVNTDAGMGSAQERRGPRRKMNRARACLAGRPRHGLRQTASGPGIHAMEQQLRPERPPVALVRAVPLRLDPADSRRGG
jgi:hypothetical protein